MWLRTTLPETHPNHLDVEYVIEKIGAPTMTAATKCHICGLPVDQPGEVWCSYPHPLREDSDAIANDQEWRCYDCDFRTTDSAELGRHQAEFVHRVHGHPFPKRVPPETSEGVRLP